MVSVVAKTIIFGECIDAYAFMLHAIFEWHLCMLMLLLELWQVTVLSLYLS